jgi:F0F1-type ATP synthase membrane subunit b/b'
LDRLPAISGILDERHKTLKDAMSDAKSDAEAALAASRK